jgi:hypothetical protein
MTPYEAAEWIVVACLAMMLIAAGCCFYKALFNPE